MDERVEVAKGAWMPLIGYGTYKLMSSDVQASLDAALGAGYRLIDTATVYRNEEAIGEALKEALPRHGLTYDDIWLTSKLAPADHGYESALKAVESSRKRLGYAQLNRPIDLYLIHWPGQAGVDPSDSEAHRQARRDSWRALEEAVARGWLRTIGISNYEPKHLDEMAGYAKILPAVHQFELHPYYQPERVIEWCQRNKVFVQTYASLGRGLFLQESFLRSHPIVEGLLTKYCKTPAQLFLRWALDHGWGVLPKATHAERILENAGCVGWSLEKEDVELMDRLREDPEARKICWDPQIVA